VAEIYFKIISQYLPGVNGENDGKPQAGQLASQLRI
jgi:hypothetical protein